MCLIIHKPKGKLIPKDIIERAKVVNPHGFGITYLDNGDTTKTTNYKSVWGLVNTSRPLVCHFRYATVGKIDKNNIHPFKINGSSGLQNASYVIYSNGTVEGFGTKTISDINCIASDVLGNIHKDYWLPFLELTDTRFAIVNTARGTVQRVGKWYKQGGVHYSKNNCFTTKYRVGVYGTLKSGFGNSHLLSDQEFVGNAYTKDKYPLEVDGLPYLHDEKGVGHNVDLEIYDIDKACLDRIDRLESHPNFYKRKVIPVDMQDWSETYAWVYFIQTRWFDDSVSVHDSYYGQSGSEVLPY